MKAGLIICCLLLLSAGTCACSNGHGAGLIGRTDSMQKTYTVREISEGNGGIKHTPLEKALPSFCEESFERAEAPKEQAVVFQEKEYQGTYRNSRRYSGTKTVIDTYTVLGGSRCGEFHVNSSTRELTYISFFVGQKELWEREKDLPRISRQEVEKKAMEIAGVWGATDEYSISLQTFWPGDASSSGDYNFRVCRMVQGIETTDYIDVLIDDRGTLLYIGSAELGWVNDHRGELESFSLEIATETAKKESGLSAPSVQVQRFGISADDEVFLMLMLSGSGNEQPVVLAVTEN